MFRPMDTSATPTPHPPDKWERGFSYHRRHSGVSFAECQTDSLT